MLYIVATPIGNLEDITLRALRILHEADFIAAEDTRHSGILLKKYEITRPLLSFHSYSSDEKLQKLLGLLREGKVIALISDAGTPGISDPGSTLINKAIEAGVKVVAIPGPSSTLAAAVVSGLPIHRFTYLGFLPVKKGRKHFLEGVAKSEYTTIFFEAPHRLEKTLADLLQFCEPGRPVAVCRELTKMYEEIFRGTLGEAASHFTIHTPRGEFTLVVGDAP